jgi:3-oxoadipate enol-lactonase
MQVFDSNGVRIHFADARQARPVTLVFANSLGTDFRIWDEVVARLSDSIGTIRHDKRGHGLSDAPPDPYTLEQHVGDFAGLLDHLGVERAIVVGISVGGMIAQALALARPALVSGLVLCDTGACIGTAQMWNDRIDAVRKGGLESIADAVLDRWFSDEFLARRREDLAIWRNLLVRTPAHGYAGTCAALRDADLRDQVGAIDVPALCLCGDEDAATPPDLVRELAGLIPGAEYREVEQAGHLPCIEQPGVVADAIGYFLKESGLV